MTFSMILSAITVKLSDKNRQELTAISNHPGTRQRDAFRCRCVLMCADGVEVAEVARQLKTTRMTVRKWRDRFMEKGMDGLRDDPRSGQPRKLSQQQVDDIVRTVQMEPPPAGRTHWSCTTLAERFGTSAMTISRILRAYRLQPHRTQTFKISNDPHLAQKVRDVVGLYLNPSENAMVFCMDEKSQIQALDRTQPLLPLRPGQVERRTHDYVRHGTATLFAALEIATGKVIGQISSRHRAKEFLAFVKKLDRETPKNMQLHLVLDNYATHKTAEVRQWLEKHPRFHLHFTPTGGSWLNMVESWFSGLTKKRLKRGIFHSLQELVEALEQYLEINNKNPKPFVWTKPAEDLLNHKHMDRNSC